MTGTDPDDLQAVAIDLCAKAFGTDPGAGVLTFVSRGTDDDARGVLAGFGLTGDIERVPGDEGWDIITVTLRKTDLERIPESRIHTALEASTNCEVRIRTRVIVVHLGSFRALIAPETRGSPARPAPRCRTC